MCWLDEATVIGEGGAVEDDEEEEEEEETCHKCRLDICGVDDDDDDLEVKRVLRRVL